MFGGMCPPILSGPSLLIFRCWLQPVCPSESWTESGSPLPVGKGPEVHTQQRRTSISRPNRTAHMECGRGLIFICSCSSYPKAPDVVGGIASPEARTCSAGAPQAPPELFRPTPRSWRRRARGSVRWKRPGFRTPGSNT